MYLVTMYLVIKYLVIRYLVIKYLVIKYLVIKYPVTFNTVKQGNPSIHESVTTAFEPPVNDILLGCCGAAFFGMQDVFLCHNKPFGIYRVIKIPLP